MVNVKDTIKDASAANNAYFYKLTGSTIYGESSHWAYEREKVPMEPLLWLARYHSTAPRPRPLPHSQ
ncbi:hypothetical protein DM01DRAFT_1377361 [Hesseltinella vesiculosa]|uniref:Uncharacterized protein n=1 Tax=Hesseltinella vesiculosa TaxID=101127 RepID=A0A1X2G780_9FUNG|nr:hypothetical protein DM01DRAFT_1377361 [Hesseltinella vesiculosa]